MASSSSDIGTSWNDSRYSYDERLDKQMAHYESGEKAVTDLQQAMARAYKYATDIKDGLCANDVGRRELREKSGTLFDLMDQLDGRCRSLIASQRKKEVALQKQHREHVRLMADLQNAESTAVRRLMDKRELELQTELDKIRLKEEIQDFDGDDNSVASVFEEII